MPSALVQIGWAFLDYFSNNFSYVSPHDAIDRFDKEDAGFLQDTFQHQQYKDIHRRISRNLPGIRVPENGKIITSEDSYFYDYNAVKAAKVKIDELFK